MARNRSRGTLVDYLVAAIEPALIMVMVGSLMFFLLDIWYEGPVLERLRWILFWFVFGIVLITRVSMQIGTSLAKGYGLALGGAVALVSTLLTGFHPFLIVVLGIVWWATHKLTFDCTLLDEDQDAGVGLLQESGLDRSALADTGEDATSSTSRSHDDPDAMDTSLLPARPWWKLWELDSGEAARRPHAPGVWLVYFTLASLPLFGIGQWLVPAVEEDRRAWLFLYFLAYIASGMGLLLATSFLNLRRYLRRRKLKMPAAMTATWLTTGSILIVGLTVLAAAVPLPGAGWSVLRGSTGEPSDLRASRHAILKDSGVQGEGARSEGAAASKGQGPPPSSKQADGSGQENDPNAAQQTAGKGRPGGSKGPGRSKSGAPRGKPSGSKSGSSAKKGAAQDQAKESGKSEENRGENKADRGKDDNQNSEQNDKESSKPEDENSSQKEQNSSSGSNSRLQLPSLPFAAFSWLQPVVIAVGVVFLVLGAIRYGRDILRALLDLIRSLFGGLFIAQPEKKAKDEEPKPAVPPRPFASYVNPFDAGLDHQFSPDDLIIYSFEALEAWAWENNLGRSPHETPIEFAQRVGQTRDDLRTDSARLVGYFVAIVYGQRGFRAEVFPSLRQFWQVLRS